MQIMIPRAYRWLRDTLNAEPPTFIQVLDTMKNKTKRKIEDLENEKTEHSNKLYKNAEKLEDAKGKNELYVKSILREGVAIQNNLIQCQLDIQIQTNCCRKLEDIKANQEEHADIVVLTHIIMLSNEITDSRTFVRDMNSHRAQMKVENNKTTERRAFQNESALQLDDRFIKMTPQEENDYIDLLFAKTTDSLVIPSGKIYEGQREYSNELQTHKIPIVEEEDLSQRFFKLKTHKIPVVEEEEDLSHRLFKLKR